MSDNFSLNETERDSWIDKGGRLHAGFSKPYPVPVRGYSTHDRKTLVFAIDLDGTLAEFNGQPGKFVGAVPRPNAVITCGRLWRAGHTLLLDTVRSDEWHLKGWLAENFKTGAKDGIGNPKHMFSGINCNPADVARHGIVAGHLYADVYINDRNWMPCRVEHGQQIDWFAVESDFESRGWI